MKANETHQAQQRKRHDSQARKIPRRGEHSPIGFRSMLANLKRNKASAANPANVEAMYRHSANTVLHPGHVASAVQIDAHTIATADSVTAAESRASSSVNVAEHHEAQGPNGDALHLSPSEALRHIADQAANSNRERSIKQLRIELEPEHLGPLVVKLRVEKGRIYAELNVRDPHALELLSTDDERLRKTLRDLGFSEAQVVIQQQNKEYFE